MSELPKIVLASREIRLDRVFSNFCKKLGDTPHFCSVKKVFLEILQNSQESTCVGGSF